MLPNPDPFWGALTDFTFRAMIVWLWAVLLGTPVLMYAMIRFFWYRHVYVGRSQELEKLIWQLHRIASAMEKTDNPPKGGVAPIAEPNQHPVHLSMFGR